MAADEMFDGGSALPPSQHYSALACAIRAMLPGLKLQQVKDELTTLAEAYEKLARHVAAKADGAVVSGGTPTLSISALPPSALAVGETYDSWLCEACRHSRVEGLGHSFGVALAGLSFLGTIN